MTFEIPRDLTGDAYAVAVEVKRVQEQDSGEISDACARTIASWFHNGQASNGYAFVSTGVILGDHTSDLWRELGGSERGDQPEWMRAALDCLGTYLIHRESRDAVPGWSNLWVR